MPSTCTAPAGQLESPKHYPRYTTTNDTYAHGLYHDVLDEDEAKEYLQETEIYDYNKKRWSIPEVLTSPEALVNTLCTIISSVMGRFVKTTEPGVERQLANIQGDPGRKEKNENGYALCPALVVSATGPSFEIPARLRDPHLSEPEKRSVVGYAGMATFFTVRLDSNPGCVDEIVDEMETYARHILQDQPNRRFVRALVLTENYVRLAHFDRAGTEITPPLDIHQHPTTFIRLVAGLSSANERVLGIDTSIQWTIVNGRKAQGTLTTTGPDGSPRTYRILERFRTPRDEIRGRATTCWRVQDPDTLEEFLVKDSWRSDDRRGEYELLELVKGIPGVVQMISYETGRGETRDFRCPSTSGSFQNCVATRVMMELYGRSIQHFTSILQLLCAIRDAIAGHRKLVADDIQILHRDISPQNVLLGKIGAPEGERGVLIDFDLAFKATDSQPTIEVDDSIGVRIFQSLHALSSRDMRPVPIHDYLDDLESFFYLLVYVLLLFRPDGSCLPITEEGPSILLSWNDDCASDAFTMKQRISSGGPLGLYVSSLIKASWGPIFEDLFDKLQGWMMDRRDEKERLAYQKEGPEHLLPKRDEYYSAVLDMFDQAIDAVNALPPIPTHEPPALPQPVSNPGSVPPTSAPQPRRSARIRNLTHPQPEPPSHVVAAVPSRTHLPTPTTPPARQPRRSVRIQKRRLERDEEPDAPRPTKTRRITKGTGATQRRR